MHARKLVPGLAACTLLAAVAAPASAQTYPLQPVKVVVAYPPGGPTDLIGRIIAQRLGETMGQQFFVENRAGSNGVIGTEVVVRSKPDGYTLLLGTSSLASNGSLYAKLPYDASKDLTPICLTASTPYFLAVNSALPVNSVKELIALAKAKPGALHFGSAGNGSGPHLAGEMFNMDTGVKMVHVPYKGTGPASADVAGGQIQLIFVGLPALSPHVKSGKVRLLAVAEPKRVSLTPDLPTVAEAGVPGFESSAWFAFFGPAGLPRELPGRIATEVGKVMQAKEIQDKMIGFGAVPLWNTPAQFEAYFRGEVVRYARLIKAANVVID